MDAPALLGIRPRPATDPAPPAGPLAPGASSGRIASLDQFRGYTVVAMLAVNFLSGFEATPAWLKHHHTYCSYADTVMPQFLLAVGFGYRLSLRRRLAAAGASAAYRHVVGRCVGLIALGFVLYHLDGGAKTWAELTEKGLTGVLATAFQRSPFQTLVHIGLTSLWVLPVINGSVRLRLAYMIGSGALHFLLSRWFYYDFAISRPVIDGGVLGFLTWTTPLLAGSLAYDAVSSLGPKRSLGPILAGGAVLMVAGYAISCAGGVVPPPFVPPDGPTTIYTMSQRAGSVSYLTFSAGFALAVYAAFVVACDLGPLRLGVFGTFGRNALVAYVLHEMVAAAIKPYVPRDSPGWYVAVGFAGFFALTYLFVRRLEKDGVFIRL